MAAANTDYFQEVGAPGTATTLDAPGHIIGGTTFTVVSTNNWPSTTGVTFAVDQAQIVNGEEIQIPGSYTEWIGTVVSATSITNAEISPYSPNSDRNYPAGSLTRVYIPVSATRENKLVQGIRLFANQNGSLKTQAVKDALGITGDPTGGWSILTTIPTVSSGYNKGNKEFELTFPNVDLRTTISPGMRLKLGRTGAIPTQCTDLERDTSQYWSKSSPTGITFTDDFTCEAWVKLESYTGAQNIIAARMNAAATQGWRFIIDLNGCVEVAGWLSSGNLKQVISYQSIPLNQWVHVAVTMDMSSFTTATNKIFINGSEVPALLTPTGTASALTQPSDPLFVGARATPTEFFDGEIAQLRIWSAIRTPLQIRDNMSISTVGNESNLIADFKFDGNGNDSTANANNLTPSGGATATTLDNPFKATEFAEIVSVVYSAPDTVVIVRCPDEFSIPNMTLQNPFYSGQDTPVDWPGGTSVLALVELRKTFATSSTSPTSLLGLTATINVPKNSKLKFSVTGSNFRNASAVNSYTTISVDGVPGTGRQLGQTQIVGAAADQRLPLALTTYDRPTPGQHTYYVGAYVQSGTGAWEAATNSPIYLCIERVK